MVRALLSVLSPEERTALDSAAARLNSAAPLAAKAIEHIADSLAARVQKQDIDPAAVLRAVAGNIQRIADGGVNAAEQATMTLDALGTNSEATAPLYDYLEHPSLYRPSEFVTLFQKAAAKQ
jgi:phosphate uptake regulator